MSAENITDLFDKKLQVINIGLESFARNIQDEGVEVVQLEWSPPAGGDEEMASLLDMLED